jgi:hypothetical protein
VLELHAGLCDVGIAQEYVDPAWTLLLDAGIHALEEGMCSKKDGVLEYWMDVRRDDPSGCSQIALVPS